MTESKVIVSLPSIEQAVNSLGKNVLETGVTGAASAAVGRIKENWSKGKGGEGDSLEPPAINSQYKKFKESSGRKGVIDFKFKGDLSNSFGVKEVNYNKAIISFREDQLPKARGLMERRPQGLEVGEKLNTIASNFFNKWLRSVVKFQK